MKLRDRTTPPTPDRRKFTFTSNTTGDGPGHRIVPPQPASPGDPTIHGATLIVYDSAGSGERVSIALDGGGWTASGSLAKPKYRYRDTTGPISRVSLRADRVTITGGRTGFGYTLDEPRQGRMAIRLVLGSALVLCADAPPRATGHPPTITRYDTLDRFTAAPGAPAPAACPQLPIDG